MLENNKAIKYFAFAAAGIILGAATYAYVDNCEGLTCSFTDDMPSSFSDTSERGVDISYRVTNVPEISELNPDNASDLPDDAIIRLPLAPTSQEFIVAYNDMLNASNKLEVQVRDRLPRTMYGTQEAAMRGDLSGTFDAIVETEKAIQLTDDLNQQFDIYLNQFDATLTSINPSVEVAAKASITSGREVYEAVDAFTAYSKTLTKPEPPSPTELEALGPLAENVDTALVEYVQDIQGIIDAIKTAS